jgi:iturin family lipopeptide synthetase A
MIEQPTETGLEIAVIGMAARFPGADSIQTFWNNLKQGKESVSFFTEEELKQQGVSSELLENPNFVRSKGGILSDIEYFDAEFFGYTPTEAEMMAPQLRIFHECIWTALEDAAYEPDTFDGLLGIYAGVSTTSNWELLTHAYQTQGSEDNYYTGYLNNRDFMSTLVAFKLDLKGPSFTLQTACSTSLVAIHLACQGLLTGDTDIAVAGGIAIRISENFGYLYREGMIHSSDGHCRAFDKKADGTIGGDGIGLVVLKRLEEAQKDRDHIYAIIKGSAINNDGTRKVGFTAPSIEGQVEVIQKALAISEIESEDISYIETHGTGTPLGDVTEIEALTLAFNTPKTGYCAIGSVKTNVGHLDTAAGAAGFIKTVLSLKNRYIPKSLNFETPNPMINFSKTPFYVNTTLKEWEKDKRVLAGVSSFGIGGTNAHVILEGIPSTDEPVSQETETANPVILLSAKTTSALDKMTRNLEEYVNQDPKESLIDIAYTLQQGRRTFPYRRKWSYTQKQGIKESRKFQDNYVTPGEKAPEIIFVFPGLGNQYVQMGIDLYQREPEFKKHMDLCFEELDPVAGVKLRDILYPSEKTKTSDKLINQIENSQYAVFVLEYSLARLLMTWGIQPTSMIGYSFGEYTAACISGVLSLKNALKLITIRGRLIQNFTEGMMMSVPLTSDKLKPQLKEPVSLAIDNGNSCVISGPREAVLNFEKKMREKRWVCIPLDAPVAIHSGMMDPLLGEFEKQIQGISLGKPRIPYISNVTGDWIKPEDTTTPGYWTRHLRETVQFSRGLEQLRKGRKKIFLEVGPGGNINALLKRQISEDNAHYFLSLVRNSAKKVLDDQYLNDKIGEMWLYGVSPDWKAFYTQKPGKRLPLPTYPFERKRFWKLIEAYETGNSMTEFGKIKNKQNQGKSQRFYIPSWKKTLSPITTVQGETKQAKLLWLILAEKTEICTRLINQLRQQGDKVIPVLPGIGFSREKDHLTIAPSEKKDYQELIRELKDTGDIPQRILHMWGIRSLEEDTSPEAFRKYQEKGFNSLLYLTQSLKENKVAKGLGEIKGEIDKLQIILLISHLYPVTNQEDIHPAKSAITGLCKTIPQEYPNLVCRVIDIDTNEIEPEYREKWISQLVWDMRNINPQLTVAYRGFSRWEQYFEPIESRLLTQGEPRLRKNGVYLITGGLGNDSYYRSKHLAQEYQAKLVLVGRTQLPDRAYWSQYQLLQGEEDPVWQKIERVKTLENLGAEVLVISADVSDETDMRNVLAQTDQQFGELHGVIHAAGITTLESSSLIMELGKEESEVHFHPKVYGLYLLEKLLAGRQIDFCLLTSSIASIVGGIGLSAYTAASICMDTYAHQHNKHSQIPWISLNWHGASEEETTDAFKKVLSLRDVSQVIYSQADLHQLIRERQELTWKYSQREDDKKKDTPLFHRPDLSNPYVEPRNKMEVRLAEIWQRFFGIENIGVTDDLFDLGGDSLKAINIISIIHSELKVHIPIKYFIEHSTIEAVASYLKEAKKEAYHPVTLVEQKEYYPLSSAQKRIYILHQMEPMATVYNTPIIQVLKEKYEIQDFEEALAQLVERHESLRTSFFLKPGEPVQKVHHPKEVRIPITYYEINKPSEIKTYINEFIRPFELAKAPLFRAGLITINATKQVLLFDIFHIITDGTSQRILEQEFMALLSGKQLKALKVQYKDYTLWQEKEKHTEAFKNQEKYWLNRFQEIPVLELPLDKPRPKNQTFEGSAISFKLKATQEAALRTVASRNEVTLFTMILANYNILLSKISGQEEIVAGITVEGRRHADLGKIIGICVNTLAIKSNLPGKKKVLDFISEVKNEVLNALENQEYPFEDLVEKLNLQRDIQRNPIFDVMLVHQDLSIEDQESKEETGLSSWESEHLDYEINTAKFDLTLLTQETEEGISFTFEYSTRLFQEETMYRFVEYFKIILDFVTHDQQKKLQDLQIITEEEKRRILYQYNDTQAPYPDQQTISELFEEQVKKSPNRLAVLYKEESLTYEQLNIQAEEVAKKLTGQGVQVNTIVGILMKRSLEMIYGIYGIVKAGGAYLPIDPGNPRSRIMEILQDSFTEILMEKEPDTHELNKEITILYLGKSSSETGREEKRIQEKNDSMNIAYVMYTSGTTGKPRGVLVNHQSVINRIYWGQQTYPILKEDRWLQKTPIVFDVSVVELFWWGFYGASLCLLEPGNESSPKDIVMAIERNQVTHIHFVPSQIAVFFEYHKTIGKETGIKSLKQVFFSGEPLKNHHVTGFKNSTRKNRGLGLVNLYGPTEATIEVSEFDCTHLAAEESVYIGKPISNIRLYILDKYRQIQPIGIPGELCIAGEGLARGYLNAPELTGEKFPLEQMANRERIYMTGDFSRMLPDGNIEYLGRKDKQVKIRGIRVEIAEIEGRLLKQLQIQETIVRPIKSDDDEVRLVAYIVSVEKEISLQQVREKLQQELPGYMVPTYIMRLDKIPLKENGKVDTSELPDPLNQGQREKIILPANEIEKKLLEIWSSILGITKEKISVEHSFFELGGHSLKATILAAGIQKEFKQILSLTDIFRTPSIRGLGTCISASGTSRETTIQPVELREYYPVSFSQKRIYILDQLEGQGVSYNMPQIFHMEGKLEPSKIETTFNELIVQQESLRTYFEIKDGEPVQRIQKRGIFKLEHDSIQENPSVHKAQVTEIIRRFVRPFDLTEAPLLRVGLVKEDKTRHVLLIDIHHIITDGMSQQILVREFIHLYNGEKPESLSIQYKDYTQWQMHTGNKELRKSQEIYWTKEYEGEMPQLELPLDFPRPEIQSFEGKTISLTLAKEITRQIKTVLQHRGVTLFMFLLAAYTQLLSQLSGQEDVVVGTPIAGRSHPDTGNLVGIFVNTLALRNYPIGEKSIEAYLAEVKERTLEAFENQDYPFEELVRKVYVQRDTSRNPLFDTVLVLQHPEQNLLKIPELKLRPIQYQDRIAKFDLTLMCEEGKETICLSCNYSIKLFEESTIQRYLHYFERVIQAFTVTPEIQLSQIEIISPNEKEQILERFNHTEMEFPLEKTINELFEIQAEKSVHQACLQYHETIMTYQEVNQRANQLARALEQRGVSEDTIVAVMIERSSLMVLGILAALKAGAAYLPVSLVYPVAKREYILRDSASEVVLTGSKFTGEQTREIKIPLGNILCLDNQSDYKGETSNLNKRNNPQSLAYVIYTSGTTGPSKGVSIRQASLVNFVYSFYHYYKGEFSSRDMILTITNISFDISVCEIFLALTFGTVLNLYPETRIMEPGNLARHMKDKKITFTFVPVGLLKELNDHLKDDLPGVVFNKLMTGAEPVKGTVLNDYLELKKDIQIINAYGPTETTIVSATQRYYRKSCINTFVPIGKPMPNTKIVLLNTHLQVTPIGLTGEICISGIGVARGYLNRPELTAEKYIMNPYFPVEKMYKTGDLARWTKQGYLEFLGRRDRQVKIRGFRVELGEIEAQLLQYREVKEAVVELKENKEREKILCAYIVSEVTPLAEEMRDYLYQFLPYYMIPHYFIQIDQIPLTANRKIDKSALPEPGFKVGLNFMAPNTPLEERLAKIWSEVLGISKDKIGIHTNFFEMGGDSLRVFKLKNQVKKELGKEIPMVRMFTYPTIHQLAQYLDQEPGPGQALEKIQEESEEKAFKGRKKTLQESIHRINKIRK